MNTTATKKFFADFVEANPLAAHLLMIEMLQKPTGGHLIALPRLIETNDNAKYWKEIGDVAKKYILKPRANKETL